jgi:hypothetical protein
LRSILWRPRRWACSSYEVREPRHGQCDVGTKTNNKERKSSWVGYKLHGDVADGNFLISCVLTSASVNDTQVAIPFAEMTAVR